MRILHTSDWHLGAKLAGTESRMEEQVQVMDEIIGIADENNAQIIIISGDIYHSYNPSAEAEMLYYRTVTRLSRNGERAVVIIAGNHDNPERLCAASPLFLGLGTLAVGSPRYALPVSGMLPGHIEMHDRGSNCFTIQTKSMDVPVTVFALPHTNEGRIKTTYSAITGQEGATYTDALQYLFNEASQRFTGEGVNVLAAHLYASGGILAGDESGAAIGGTEGIPLSILPKNVQYCALGHLHRPQVLEEERGIAYCGSPLQYHTTGGGKQCVYLADVEPGGRARIMEVPLTSGKKIAHWKASGFPQALELCRSQKDRGAWLFLEIELDEPLKPSETAALRAERSNDLIQIKPIFKLDRAGQEAPDIEGMSFPELFREFYKTRMKREPGKEVMELFTRLSSENEEEEREGEDEADSA